MKLTCNECEEPLEFTDLHEDGTELLIKPCKTCAKEQFDAGYGDGLNNCGCSEEDYQEGYNEAEAYYQEKIDVLEDKISDLEDEITELKKNS